ncbi:hypothetical protein Alches_14270 [Alicyclobacillus hesperidum subsp. aegles]|nr:hypothetical protein Alches_14270 [Alicyclobacillus hesperidum subsp. aegles]
MRIGMNDCTDRLSIAQNDLVVRVSFLPSVEFGIFVLFQGGYDSAFTPRSLTVAPSKIPDFRQRGEVKWSSEF